MHCAAKIYLAFLINLVSVGISLSQSTLRLPFTKKISIEDGLSGSNIRRIIQDKYGFIWIATQDGLSRYDSKSFLVYNTSTGPGYQLLGKDVWDIEEDSHRDILWVVTPYGGLNGIDLKTAKVCWSLRAQITEGGFISDWLRCIKLQKDNLWIGTNDGLTVYNIKTKTFERCELFPFVKKQNSIFSINKIFIDQYENVWVFIDNYGIAIYSAKQRTIIYSCPLTKLSLNQGQDLKQFKSVTYLNEENLLIGTNQGFRRVKYTKTGIAAVSSGLFDNDNNFAYFNIEASGIDSFQRVWFSTATTGLFKADLNNRTIQQVKDASVNFQDDWLNYIPEIFFDKANNIWLGTLRGVAYTKNTVPAFMLYNISEDQATRINHAYYIYPHNDSVIYAGTETSLLKVNINQNKIVTLDEGKLYYFITEHVDKNLLVSTDKGFFVYRPENNTFYAISKFYTELAPISLSSVNTVLYAGDSLAIIGTEKNGSFVWNYKKKSLKKINQDQIAEASKTNIVNTCYEDKKGRIWVLSDNLITLYEPLTGKTKVITLNNKNTDAPYNVLFDICEAKDYFWIAAYGTGLIQIDTHFNSIKNFSGEDGLSSTGVNTVFPVNDSLIFISTNNGLSVLNLNTYKFSNYYHEDGLNSNAFEENCGIYKNDKIYVGGLNGFTIIDPGLFSTNKVPPELYLNHIRIETNDGFIDTSNVLLHTIQIPSNVLQTTLSFSALNYSNPLRTAYAYRIKELNSDWIPLGTQNIVSLIGLSPGKHSLLVKSANEHTVWNSKPLELSLIYLPKWYETDLFKLSILLVAIAVIYGLYKLRINQLKKELRIRTKLASDLHDDLGSTLNSVNVYTNLAILEKGKEKHLYKIRESIQEALLGIRDIIWILDDKKGTFEDLVKRVDQFALPLCEAYDIAFMQHCSSDALGYILNQEEKRNVYLIIKESITNCIKYADAHEIQITILMNKGKPTVTIADDGKGFDSSKNMSGNGLKNMKSRAAQIHYNISIRSLSGTTIELKKF